MENASVKWPKAQPQEDGRVIGPKRDLETRAHTIADPVKPHGFRRPSFS